MSIPFSPENILPGTRVGVYVIVSRLAIGGGGVVYQARSPRGHLVALKVSRFRPGVPGSRDSVMDGRFFRGHLCQEQLHGHPNVLELYGFDRHPDPLEGWQYEVLELVPGAETITDWARRTRPSLKLLILVFQRLAVTLGDMHWLGIRHRDIKPGNIVVSPDGVPKILDFNSATYVNAKLLTKPAASALPGTAAYLPPEVCRAVLRERWTGQPKRFAYQPTGDLHALGVILYETLTGRHPFNLDLEGDDLLVDIAHRTPERPTALNPDVPAELEEVVMMLLAKDPEKRHQSAYTVAAELGMLLNLSAEARKDSPFEVPRGEWTNGHRSETRPLMPADAEAPTTPDQNPPWFHAPPAGADAALVRIEPQPALDVEARPAPPLLRRRRTWLRLGLALLLLVLVGGVSLCTTYVMTLKKGTQVSELSSKGPIGRAVVALTCALVGCQSVKENVRVRQEGPDFLSQCPAEARATPEKLSMARGWLKANIQQGKNVIYLSRGIEIRDGELHAEAHLGQRQRATLLGTARTGADGVSIQFDRIQMGEAPPGEDPLVPVGTVLPICAIAWDVGTGSAGYPDFSQDGSVGGPPESERHPGYVGVRTNFITIRVAR